MLKKYILIHVPHASLNLPEGYKKQSLLTQEELERENLFMCDYSVDKLLKDKRQAIIFPYSRLFCDVERFKDDTEIMNKYGMGFIYTKDSKGNDLFRPNQNHITVVSKIYDEHHKILDERVTNLLETFGKCVIIDLHSYSSEQVKRLFDLSDCPDICIGIEKDYYSQQIVDYFVSYFESNGYSTMIDYPYKGSIVPNKYFGQKDSNIVSIMIEINKRVYVDNLNNFKILLWECLENMPEL